MPSNTKYTAAPQQDPDETASYSQAPPSYEPSASTDQAALLGGTPRNHDDNDPDDFNHGVKVAEASIDIRMAFVRKVYAILSVQLIATAALSTISFFHEGYKNWIQENVWLMWTSLFGTIVFLLLTFWKRKSYPTNLIFLSGFTLVEAYSISVVVSFYESSIVLKALLLTAGIFIGLTLIACQSKYDFTAWQPYLAVALWGLILVGFMAIFLPGGGTFELVYAIGGALLFSVYILVDTQLIMRTFHVEEEIAAAISLYLDIINLFLFILRILNNTSNN